MTSNLKVNNILPSTGTTVAVSGIASVTSSVSIASSCTATTFYGSGANLTNIPAQATISNNADNRIITGGSGVNLNGEAGLTYDGSELIVRGSDTVTSSGGTKTVALRGGDANNEKVNLSFETGAGGPIAVISGIADATGVYPNTTGSLTFNTQVGGGVFERLRIASDGRTLINTTAVTNTHDFLTVVRPASGFGEMSMTVDANTSTSSAANAFIFTKSKHTYWNGYGFQSSHGHIGAIVGKRDSTGGDSDQEIRIEIGGTHINQSEEKTWNFKNNGDLSISDGNLVVASGHGISFAADANTSGMTGELLDDYETGTWTPDMVGSSGSDSWNYRRAGKYTKIGNKVTASWSLGQYDGNLSGDVFISNLPFTIDFRQYGGDIGLYDVNTPSGTIIGYFVYLDSSTTNVRLYWTRAGQQGVHMNSGHLIGGNRTFYEGNVTYYTNS